MGSDSVARADFAPLTQPDSESESEIGSQVDVGVLEELGGEVDVLAARVEISVLGLRAALATLDTIDLEEVFCTQACIMKSPPAFVRGAYRAAMKVVLK